jgi:hypothetical protein
MAVVLVNLRSGLYWPAFSAAARPALAVKRIAVPRRSEAV